MSLYAQRINRDIPENFQLADAISAAEKIADLERGEGELAFPEVGTILKMATVQKIARLNRESLERERSLVMWACRVCGYRRSGFPSALESAYRKCTSPWGPLLPVDAPRSHGERPERILLPTGQTCGNMLDIESDERRRAG